MIRLANIEKCFSHGVTKTYVLRRIDLEIQQGEFVSIMGPSGAGKSTLLHILGMHDQSWGGEYYFDDVAIHSLNARKRADLRNRNVGFVFQSYHLLDDQTVFENLELPLSYRDVDKKARQSIVCDTLDRFQIVGKRIFSPASSPVGSNNSWALPGRLSPIPASSSLTSLPAIFTQLREKKSWRCSSVSTTRAPPSSRLRTLRQMLSTAIGLCGWKMVGW